MQEAQECDAPPDLMATGVSSWCPEPDLPQHPGDPQVLSPSPPITSSRGCLTPKQGGLCLIPGIFLCFRCTAFLHPHPAPSAGSCQPHILPRPARMAGGVCPLGVSLVPRWPVVTDGEAGGGIRGSFLRAPTQRDAAARATQPPRAGFGFGEALS